jgi:hypothetical protein
VHHLARGRPVLTRDKYRELKQRSWLCTPAAAERDFGWKARTPLADGMARSVEDWKERGRQIKDGAARERRARAVQTYTLAILAGVIVESVALIGDWYKFDPWWLIFVVIFGIFGGVMGSIAYFGVRWPWWALVAAGLFVAIGLELLNAEVLHLWEFNPDGFGRLPGPWLRSIVLGLPGGVMPPILVLIVRKLYQRRLRLG